MTNLRKAAKDLLESVEAAIKAGDWKAAGVDWFDDPAANEGKGLHKKSGPFWNPLTDDGDALHLAVKLQLRISHFALAVVVEYNGTTHIEINELVNEDNGDRYAATRRAIVRAAAEIGKEMK